MSGAEGPSECLARPSDAGCGGGTAWSGCPGTQLRDERHRARQSILSRWAALEELSSALAEGVPCLQADGLWGSSRALVVAALVRRHGPARPARAHAGAAERHRTRRRTSRFFLATLSGGAATLPRRRCSSSRPGSRASWRGGRHREHDAERALVLPSPAGRASAVAVVTTPVRRSSLPLLPPARVPRARRSRSTSGESIDREILLERLERGRLRARRDGGRGRAVEPARRHRRRLLAHARAAGAGGVLRRRGRVAARLRSHHPALGRAARASSPCCRWASTDEAPRRCPTTCRPTRWWCSTIPPCSTRRPTTRRRPQPLADAARPLPAPRAAAAPARRGRGAARRHGHALGGRLPGPVQGAGRRDPRLAGRGLRGAARRGRRAAGRAAPADAGRARARAVAGRDALEPGGARRDRGRVRGGLPASRARPRRPLPRRRSSAPSAAASAGPLFQRGAAIAAFTDLAPNDLVVHEDARHRPLPRPPHACRSDGRDARLPAARVRRGRPALPARRAARPHLQVHGRARRAPPGSTGSAAARGSASRSRCAPPLREMAEELLQLYAARSVAERPRLLRRHALAGRVRGGLPLRGDAATSCAPSRTSRPTWSASRPDGPAGGGRRRLRQDRGRAARRLQGGGRRPPGRGAGADDRAGPAALQHLQRALRAVSRRAWSCSRASAAPRSRRRWSRGSHAARVDVVIGTHRLLSKDVAVQEPGPPGGRRGAPLRRRPQGADQAAAHRGGRADAHRHADPAHAVHVALRRARPLGHRDAAARPAAGGDRRHRRSAGASSRRRSSASSRAAARSSSSTTASSRSPP